MNSEPHPPGSSWQQVTVQFDDYASAERVACAHLRPGMAEAEAAGLAGSWWYIRKAPYWRLRYLPSTAEVEQDATQFVRALLAAHGELDRAVTTIYEPEIHAFGGDEAMDVAHCLFHHDSRHILDYLGDEHRTSLVPAHRRHELSVMLCAVLMRAAGLDWSEQGDVWARVAEYRPAIDEKAKRHPAVGAGVRRLLTVDAGPTSPLVGRSGPLATVADWVTAFHSAGAALRRFADNGTLARGVRAVLAHHVIFHWNRMGLPYHTQSTLAHTAKEVILGH